MTYDAKAQHRRFIRLQGYDYTQAGGYFITICVQNRACLVGDVVDGEMRLNEYGAIVEQCWLVILRHFSHVELETLKRINERLCTELITVWQRNYYEHIIRDERLLSSIMEYIVNNPAQWGIDCKNLNIVGATGRSPLPKDEPWRI